MPKTSQVHVPGPMEKDFTIVQEGGKWCLKSKSSGENLGCHDSKEEAEAQEKAVQANKAKEFSILELSVDQMRELCTPCADKMQERGISKLKLDTSKENLGLKEASEQLKASVAKYGLGETHNIKGVEIFAVGEWNGDRYTLEDLEAIEASFRETKPYLKPYLKLGHGDEQSLLRSDELPNAGYVSRVYLKGDRLVADFERIPGKVFDVLRAGAYERLSCEIYKDVKINGKKYPYALKAVGLLGGETPAVEKLDDVLALFANDPEVIAFGTENKARAYDFAPAKGGNKMPGKECAELLEEARKELDEYKKKSMALEADAKKFSDENVALKAKAEGLEKDNAALKSDKEGLEKKYAEASATIEKVESEKRQAEVETRVSKLVSDKKVLPAQAPALKALLLNASGTKKFKLGEKEELEGEEALILSIFDKGGAGLPTKESTELGNANKIQVDGKHTEAFKAAVKKYADENKVTFKEAYVRLSAELDEKEQESGK